MFLSDSSVGYRNVIMVTLWNRADHYIHIEPLKTLQFIFDYNFG